MTATTNDKLASIFTLTGHPTHGEVTFLVWRGDDTVVVACDEGDTVMSVACARELYRRLRDECRAAR